MAKKQQSFGDDLIQAMTEALAHAKGEAPEGSVDHHIELATPDPKKIRKRLDMTQDQMAQVFGISVYGYRKWEQGQRRVSGAAINLLRVMEKEPEAVMRALRAA